MCQVNNAEFRDDIKLTASGIYLLKHRTDNANKHLFPSFLRTKVSHSSTTRQICSTKHHNKQCALTKELSYAEN